MFENFFNKAREPRYSIDEFVDMLYSNAQDDTPVTFYFEEERKVCLLPEHAARVELCYYEQSLLDPEEFILEFHIYGDNGRTVCCGDIVEAIYDTSRSYDNARIDDIIIEDSRSGAYVIATKRKWSVLCGNNYGEFWIIGRPYRDWLSGDGSYL